MNVLIKEKLELIVLTANSLHGVKVFAKLASIRFEIALIKAINISSTQFSTHEHTLEPTLPKQEMPCLESHSPGRSEHFSLTVFLFS